MKQGENNFPAALERINGVEVCPDSHHYVALSLLNAWIQNVAAPASKGVLLDLGCGGQPYRKVFEPYIQEYIGADVAAAAGVVLDLVLTPDAPVSLPDATVDTILSTQVLEHVFDFQYYLADCSRLLRSDGRIILSVPMHWRHHEVPDDYWRFTKFGLTRSLEMAGFRVLDLRPCGGVYAMLGQAFLDHRSSRGKTGKILTRVVNRLSLWLDRKIQDADDTLGWMCIAAKTGDKGSSD